MSSFEIGIPSKVDASKLGYYFEVLNYYFDLKTSIGKDQFFRIQKITIVDETQALKTSADFKYYHQVGIYRNLARDLANGRSNTVDVDYFISDAKRRVAESEAPIEITVIRGEELKDEKLNLIHAVGNGSEQKPALLNLAYKGNPDSDEWFALVGKGIIYDQGGVNFKTASLENMYTDKGGACTTYAAFWCAVD